MTFVTIGNGVTSIGGYAFYGCSGLRSVIIGNSVTSIGYSAFHDCTGLTSITIPDSVTSIGNHAFSGCTGLTSITIPFVGATKNGTSNTHFGYIFGASRYSDNDNYVPASLREVVITGGTSIGDYAFSGCSGLTSVTIGNGVTSIGRAAFQDCAGLTSVTIGNGVMSIGQRAFESCSGLTSVTIGSGVTRIEDEAFGGCNKLVEVYNKSALGITAGSRGNGNVAYYAEHVYTEEGDSWFTDTADGFRFFYDGTDGYLMGYYGEETAITLPDGFTAYDGTKVAEYAIYDYAFYDCDSLMSAIIPDSVTSIGEYAFYSCDGLTSVTIPDSVTSIGDAFWDCRSLTSVTFEGTIAGWSAIEKDSYWNNNCPFTEVVCSDGTVSV